MPSQSKSKSKPNNATTPPPPPKAVSKITSLKLASSNSKRRSFSGTGSGLLNKMFGSSGTANNKADSDVTMASPISEDTASSAAPATSNSASHDSLAVAERSPERKSTTSDAPPPSPVTTEKKRRSSSVAKAKEIFSSAKQAFKPSEGGSQADRTMQTPIQKLSKGDPALGVPQGSLNNSAGESSPGPKSTFRVGVTEDKNKKCRRTMEDTHAYLYNFLCTPQANSQGLGEGEGEGEGKAESLTESTSEKGVAETDNGYFAIFDGHAGTFAADWCGKKLHHILEDTIRKNPNTPIPELLDQTFTSVDNQLEKLPLKNSGCTAVTAVLRWEDRVPNANSATGSTYLNTAAAKGIVPAESKEKDSSDSATTSSGDAVSVEKIAGSASRQRVLYTANVGDARIVLCRNGRALRLSYDHKGSDEQEGRRVANAGGLILNNRVNGVLAVTRALGDAYMKDLVTGHPYTTETVIQPEQDEFLILACDGLWDVCSDQEAVDLIRQTQDPQAASKALVDHALARFSTDNLSCMVIRFDNAAIRAQRSAHNIGVEGDPETLPGTLTEAQAIVSSVKKLQDEGMVVGPTPNAIYEGEVEEEERIKKGSPPRANEPTGAQKEQEPGPELNAEALEEAKRKKEENLKSLDTGVPQQSS